MTLAKVALRGLTPEGRQGLEQLAASRTAQARFVERARLLLALADGHRPSQVARDLGVCRPTAYTWIRRLNERGPQGLEDRPRSGRPHTCTAEQRAGVIAAALSDPEGLGLPSGCRAPDRLRDYLNEQKGLPIKRSRIGEILVDEGLKWRHQETRSGERVDPASAEERGSSRPSTRRRRGGASSSASTGWGRSRPRATPAEGPSSPSPDRAGDGEARPAGRAEQEADYGRRGKGSIFGAFRPATGEARTHPYPSRSTASWADSLGRVEAWTPAGVERVYAIADNLNAHRALDVPLFAPAFPRWESVFQPKYAAYLNLIEPWWEVLESMPLKGRRFETGEEVSRAVEEATAYWDKHRHPFAWGRRRRHRPRRRPGIAAVPGVR